MDISKDRLFAASLIFAVVMSLVFAGALVWDINNYLHGGGPTTSQRTVGGDNGADSNTSGSSGSAGTSGGTTGGGGSSAGGGANASADVIPPGADIRIGEVVTQSGPLDASDAVKADSAFVQTVNAQGGINGHKLILDSADDSADPGRGRVAFEKIVQEDKALAIVGECAPLTDATIVNEINSFQVPVVNDCLTADAGYTSPYIWFNVIKPTYWQAISARYLFKQQQALGIKKPYVLCTNTTVTMQYCHGFVDEWYRLGGTTCSSGSCNGKNASNGFDQEQVGTQRVQYDTVALNIKGSGADSIVSLLDPNNQGQFLLGLSDQHLCPSDGKPQFAPLGMDPTNVRTGGSCSNGVILDLAASYFATENTAGEQQLKAALDRYEPGTPLDSYSLAAAWTPMVIFAEAIRRMGNNISRQNLVNTLNGMAGFNPAGLARPVQWTASNHAAPPYTRWAKVTGVDPGGVTYNVITGWIDQNGDPSG